MKYTLLSIGNDAKTKKGLAYGYLTGILYLAPANESGKEVCPSRSPGCTEACLFTAGRGSFTNVREARIRKTKLFWSDRQLFLKALDDDIEFLKKEAASKKLKPCVRLNGTSDLGWEGFAEYIFKKHPDVQFYDYTKVFSRMQKFLQGKFPPNYHLTFSRSEENNFICDKVLAQGGNVAVVFDGIRTKWGSYDVIDGDLSDLRFLDTKNVVVGLKAKGKAKKDRSGFVITTV